MLRYAEESVVDSESESKSVSESGSESVIKDKVKSDGLGFYKI
jgi:hypothetical protein